MRRPPPRRPVPASVPAPIPPRPPRPQNDVNRQVVMDAIRRHRRADPHIIVAEARNPNHPWHDKLYHLNDQEAAVQYRLILCRQLIASIVPVDIVITIFERQPREFMHDPAVKSGYDRTLSIRNDRERAINAGATELRGAITRVLGARAQLSALGLIAPEEFDEAIDILDGILHRTINPSGGTAD